MKTLLTGGTGFIGSHLVDILLEEGHSVRLLTRRRELPGKLAASGVERISGDLEDPQSVTGALEDVDLFFHIGEIRNTSLAASRKNIALMEQIVSSPEVSKIRRFVFVSSITVAGIPGKVPATEDDAVEIILDDQYTFYKRTCEEILRNKLKGTGYAVIRPGIVYGPGSNNLRKMAYMAANAGTFCLPFPGSGRNIAPFIYVKDLATAIYLAGTREEAAGQTFNITDGLPHKWRDFFEAVEEATGKEIRIAPIPLFLLRMPAAFMDFSLFPWGVRADLAGYISYFSRDIHFSCKKASDLLGWTPHQTDLKVGIKEMMQNMA